MAYPIPVPGPGALPSMGSTPYQALPYTGLAGLAEGFTKGIEMGHQWDFQKKDLERQMQMLSNEAGWRKESLDQRIAYEKAMADAATQRSDALKERADIASGYAPAGQAIEVQRADGSRVTMLTDGKGGIKAIPKESGATGNSGVLEERQAAANRFLNKVDEQLKSVNLPKDGSPWGRPISWYDRIKAVANTNSPEGQLESLVNSGGPSLASSVSNRVNEAEIERQIKEFGNEAFSRDYTHNKQLIDQMRSIITSPTAIKSPTASVPGVLKAAAIPQTPASQKPVYIQTGKHADGTKWGLNSATNKWETIGG